MFTLIIGFQVLFPSGAKVKVFRNRYGLNIELQVVRAENPDKEAGLCLYNRLTHGDDLQKFGKKCR